MVIGNGSNLLVREKGIRGIVIKNEISKIEWKNNEVIVGAGVPLAAIAYGALQKEKTGLEFVAGIPGTIGGAIRMNAGAYGSEMQNVIKDTTYLDEDGIEHILRKEEQKFSYRHSIFAEKPWTIIEATLELKEGRKEEIQEKMEEYKASRREKQPIENPSAGSTFKRGDGFITAAIIDECGLKGESVGGAKVSEKHAGFIINTGGATADDVLALVAKIKKQVMEKTNKQIELEIEVVGEK